MMKRFRGRNSAITLALILGWSSSVLAADPYEPHLQGKFSVFVETAFPGAAPDAWDETRSQPQLPQERPFKEFQNRLRTFQHKLVAEETNQGAALRSGLGRWSGPTRERLEETQKRLAAIRDKLPLPPGTSFASSGGTPAAGDLSRPISMEWIEAQNLSVQRTVSDARGYMAQPEFAARTTPEARTYLRRQLTEAEQLAVEALLIARGEGRPLILAAVLANAAVAQARAVRDFAAGVFFGAVDGVQDLAKTAAAIARNPGAAWDSVKSLLRRMAGEPALYAKGVGKALVQYFQRIQQATPEEKGFAVGQLVPDMLVELGTAGVAGVTLVGARRAAQALKSAAEISAKVGQKALDVAKTSRATAGLYQLARKAGAGLSKWDLQDAGGAARLMDESLDDALFLGDRLSSAPSEFVEDLARYAKQEKFTAGKTAILSEFKDGAWKFMPKVDYDDFVKGSEFMVSKLDDNVFFTSKCAALNSVTLANGSAEVLARRLGYKFDDVVGREWVLLELPLQFSSRPRIPSGFEKGANEFFKYGGVTKGGMPEIVMTKPNTAGHKVHYLGKYD